MAAPIWPAALPQLFNTTGFYLEPIDVRAIAQTASGVDRMARQATARTDRFGGTMPMSEAQITVLDDFVEMDLAGGVRDFDFPRPVAVGPATWRARFLSPYRVGGIRNRPGFFSIQMSLVRLP